MNILPQASLNSYTTFQLGGTCKALILCQTPEELEQAVKYLSIQGEDFILIGGGSNLVVSDQGIKCYIIRYVSDTPLVERKGNELIVSASTNLDALVQYALNKELAGLNYCSGIPGTVGGAVVGNAGAFGQQVGDILKYVILLDRKGKVYKKSKEELKFSYRHSQLKETNEIVVSVCFQLIPGNHLELQKEREEILKIRHEKHPDLKKYPCAGSFFRNVEPTSKADKRQAAGWFLEQAGGKTLYVGGAKIFDKHANIIVKSHNCTAQNVHDLSFEMVRIVKEKFNLDLVREVRFVGDFVGKPVGMENIIW